MASCECPNSDGYDEERFEKEVDSKLQCPICFKVLNEPMQCPNQHYFCRFCIGRHLQENSETCPMCQHHLSEETLTKAPRIVMQFLWSMKIRCDYAERGCPELVELQFLGKHVKDCVFVPSACTNPGCPELVSLCDKRKHVEELCRFRPVMVCEECGQEVLQKFIRIHPCMMKRAMDSLAARINVLHTEMAEVKSTQQEFMTEVRNMMVGVKAASEDAIHDQERRMTTLLAEVKAANQGAVEELYRKMKVEMETKEANAEKEMTCLRKELEETKSQLTTLSKQLEQKEVTVQRPEIELHVDENDLKLKRTVNPWRRPRETEQELSKEDKQTSKLYRSVLYIMNKLTFKNFVTLVQKMMALKIDTYERLEGVVDVIIEKAIKEPMYSVLYANLCRYMFTIKVVGPDRKLHQFRTSFLNRLQLEFQRVSVFEKNISVEKDKSCEDKVDEIEKKIERETKNEIEPTSCAKQPKIKYEREFLLQLQFIPYCLIKPPYLPDVEIVLDVPNVQNRDVLRRPECLALLPSFAQKKGVMDKNIKDMDEEALVKNTKRKQGCIKLCGELFKQKLVTANILHDIVFKLLRAGDEVSLDSLCTLLGTVGKDMDSKRAKPRMDQYFDHINYIIAARKISLKLRFMLCDTVELRANKWVPRDRRNLEQQTIRQAHAEAEDQELRVAQKEVEQGAPCEFVPPAAPVNFFPSRLMPQPFLDRTNLEAQTIRQAHTEAKDQEQGMAQKEIGQGILFEFGNPTRPVNNFSSRMMPQSSANHDIWRKNADWIPAKKVQPDSKGWWNGATANIKYDALHDVSRKNSDEELMVETKSSVRKYCELCDVYDLHNKEQCPLLEDWF